MNSRGSRAINILECIHQSVTFLIICISLHLRNCFVKSIAFSSCYWVQEKETEEHESNKGYIDKKKKDPDTQTAYIFDLFYMYTKLRFQLTLKHKSNTLPFSEMNSSTNDTMKVRETIEMASKMLLLLFVFPR